MMNRPIIALDFPNEETVERFLAQFPAEEKLFLKVGMELYYQTGPSMIRKLTEKGHDVFLDLKLHDIPNTVERAMRGIAGLNVSMTNVHAAGGKRMMEAAKKGLSEGTPAGRPTPILLAVTQLTSTSETEMHQEQLINVSLEESVCHYAQLAQASGLDGVVCSAWEVEQIKSATNNQFACLTPGIRLKDHQQDDQTRIMTPDQARKIGSDYIVVGRPITQAPDPVAAYQQIQTLWGKKK